MSLLDQLDNLSLRENSACDIETAIFALHWSVDIELVVEPLIRLAAY
jgi:hypothetical protein